MLAGHNRKIPLTSQRFNATEIYPSSQLRRSQVSIHLLGLRHSGQAFRVLSWEKGTKWRRRAHWFSAGQKRYKADTLTVRWTGPVSWMRVKATDCDEGGLCPTSLSITAYLPHPHAHTDSLTFSDSAQWSYTGIQQRPVRLPGIQAYVSLLLQAGISLQDLPRVPEGRFEQLLIKGGAAKKTTWSKIKRTRGVHQD